MSHTVTIAEGTGLFQLPMVFPLEHGGALRGAQLAYERVGPAAAPLVLVQGGISAGRHLTQSEVDPSQGWWQALVGPGRAIDTDRYSVLAVDPLGGSGASTGPRHTPGRRFPPLTSTDQARALALLLDHLAAGQQPVFVGASYGGMVGLAFAALFPDRLRGLVAISAADRSHPLATAWRSLQRRIVELGMARGATREGLELARALAMVGYRTPRDLAQRFDAPPRAVDGRLRFAVEEYLLARGRSLAANTDAQAFLCLSQAIDLHRVDPAAIRTPTTLVAVRSDQLVPPEQIRSLSERLAGPVQRIEIDSLYGHDAFLKEHERISEILRAALRAAGLEVEEVRR